MVLVFKNALIQRETNNPYDFDRLIMDEQNKTPWKVWAFVIGLNVAGVLGAIYLQSKGIDVFAFRGDSKEVNGT